MPSNDMEELFIIYLQDEGNVPEDVAQQVANAYGDDLCIKKYKHQMAEQGWDMEHDDETGIYSLYQTVGVVRNLVVTWTDLHFAPAEDLQIFSPVVGIKSPTYLFGLCLPSLFAGGDGRLFLITPPRQHYLN